MSHLYVGPMGFEERGDKTRASQLRSVARLLAQQALDGIKMRGGGQGQATQQMADGSTVRVQVLANLFPPIVRAYIYAPTAEEEQAEYLTVLVFLDEQGDRSWLLSFNGEEITKILPATFAEPAGVSQYNAATLNRSYGSSLVAISEHLNSTEVPTPEWYGITTNKATNLSCFLADIPLGTTNDEAVLYGGVPLTSDGVDGVLGSAVYNDSLFLAVTPDGEIVDIYKIPLSTLPVSMEELSPYFICEFRGLVSSESSSAEIYEFFWSPKTISFAALFHENGNRFSDDKIVGITFIDYADDANSYTTESNVELRIDRTYGAHVGISFDSENQQYSTVILDELELSINEPAKYYSRATDQTETTTVTECDLVRGGPSIGGSVTLTQTVQQAETYNASYGPVIAHVGFDREGSFYIIQGLSSVSGAVAENNTTLEESSVRSKDGTSLVVDINTVNTGDLIPTNSNIQVSSTLVFPNGLQQKYNSVKTITAEETVDRTEETIVIGNYYNPIIIQTVVETKQQFDSLDPETTTTVIRDTESVHEEVTTTYGRRVTHPEVITNSVKMIVGNQIVIDWENVFTSGEEPIESVYLISSLYQAVFYGYFLPDDTFNCSETTTPGGYFLERMMQFPFRLPVAEYGNGGSEGNNFWRARYVLGPGLIFTTLSLPEANPPVNTKSYISSDDGVLIDATPLLPANAMASYVI